MKIYVGVTDTDWYRQLAAMAPDEVNFWKPGEKGGFAAVEPGGMFLFKLHSPADFIVGGGYFVRFSRLPVSLAWLAFERKNGVNSLQEFQSRIRKYRGSKLVEPDPTIGCIILTQPFFFSKDEWIPIPGDWKPNIVQGKSYDALDSVGYSLWMQVRERLGQASHPDQLLVAEGPRFGKEYVAQARLGQGAFRVLVTDAYDRRCCVSGEKTLPVLEAAHIRPYAEDGPHAVNNGLLLRSDMHILFDSGYLTVTPDFRVEVSSRIQKQYTNGKLYYSYHGEELRALPSRHIERPSYEFLDWHNREVFIP